MFRIKSKKSLGRFKGIYGKYETKYESVEVLVLTLIFGQQKRLRLF